MTSFGYTAMCEQAPVKQLVSDLAAAEEAGFDFSVLADNHVPRLAVQGHAGYAWPVLGAAAQATWQLPLMTFVSCPTAGYHPAVVAQQAATMSMLSDGRFTLGLGAGEVTEQADHEPLAEAVQIIRKLLAGDRVTFHGRHFHLDRARLVDVPASPVPLGIAVSGPGSVAIAAEHADVMIATKPDARLTAAFQAAAGDRKPIYGQLALCGPDTSRHVAAVQEYIRAGFTHIGLAQVGEGYQGQFIAWAADELLPAVREIG